MSDQSVPFRLRVMKNLCLVLEGITPENGHINDMRGRVFRGRSLYGADDPIPMISVLEPPVPLDTILSRGANTASSGDWELLVQGFVDDDPHNPTDPAHTLMADVKLALAREKMRNRGKDLFGLGYDSKSANTVMEMHIGQGSVRPPDAVSDKGFFWLLLTLKVSENLLDPYR